MDRVLAAMAVVYKLEGAEKNVRVEHPDCGHDFPDTMRREAYEFLDRALLR